MMRPVPARRLKPSIGAFSARPKSTRVRIANVETSSRATNRSLPLSSSAVAALRALPAGSDRTSRVYRSRATPGLSTPRSPSTAARAIDGNRIDDDGLPSPSAVSPLSNRRLSSSSWQYRRLWWPLTVAAAAFTALFTPWQLAFGPTENVDFYGDPLRSWEALVEAGLSLFWAADVAASLWLVEQDAGDVASVVKSTATGGGAQKRTSSSSAAPALVSSDYASSPAFLLDVASVVPFDFLAVFAFAGGPQAAAASGVLPFLSLLRLATLARLHRVRAAFSQLEYDTRLDLLWVTIARNTALVALAAHLAACGFYFAARASGFDAGALVGADRDFLLSLDDAGGERYLLSLWWALSTLSSGEFGNPSPLSVEETTAAAARTALFLGFQIALWSYILGTTTLLVVKSDERTGRFRDRSARLRDFSARSGVPADLERSMEDHLRLYFANEEASDEAVLAVMPSAIRRKALRHLFGETIKEAFLFAGTPRRFRDAVMNEARVELFLPGIDVLSEGDTVNELYLLVQGAVEAKPAPSRLAGRVNSLTSATMTSSTTESVDGGGGFSNNNSRRVLKPGDIFGELAFFTEEAQAEVVTSLDVCKVLAIPKSSLDATLRSFPAAARVMYSNLLTHAEEMVQAEFPEESRNEEFARQLRTSPSSIGGRGRGLNGGGVVRGGSLAGAGDAAVVRAAAVAAGKGGAAGDDALVKATLGRARAPLGGLSTAQRAALSDLLRVRAAVAALAAKAEEERTTRLLYAASKGRLPALRAALSEGVSPDASDYDGRTALMLASAGGHVAAVETLLAAGADPRKRDGFGSCALSEACSTSASDEIIDRLVAAGARLSSSPPSRKSNGVAPVSAVAVDGRNNGAVFPDGAASSEVSEASRLCSAVYSCDLPLLRRYIRAGACCDVGDYDGRRALHVAAAEGSVAIVRLLADEGGADLGVVDRFGSTPLDEAERVGARPVVEFLRTRGAPGRSKSSSSSSLPSSSSSLPSSSGDGSGSGRKEKAAA